MAISKITSDAIDATDFNLDGNVGIGTAPSTKLDVLSSGATIARFKRDNTGGASGGISVGNNDKLFTLYSDNVGGLQFYEDSTERIRFQLGGGISFNGDSAAANALDDFEEGSFTPTYIATVNPTVTYDGSTSGRYTKIGRQVIANIIVRTDSVSGGSGDVYIGGLPFTADSHGANRAGTLNVGYSSQWSTSYPQGGYVNDGNDLVHLTVNSSSDARSGIDQPLQVSNMQTGTNDNFIMATLFYTV